MRRSGRDEWRRRVLREEQRDEQQREERTVRGDHDNPYQESARSELQPKILDFVPRRAWVVCVILLLQLTVIAAFQSLHWAVFDSAVGADRQWLRFFDMTRTGSPASWLAAMLFAAAALFSGILFSIRRHRRDDFKGRYRVWGWLAVVLIVASANTVTGLHRLAGEGVARLSSKLQPIAQFGWGELEWSMVLVALATVAVTIRLWFEFRESKGTSCLAAASLIAFASAAMCRLGWIPAGPFEVDWLAVSLNLLGANCLFLSVLVFSRFVVLEAHGHSVNRQRRSTMPAATVEASADEADASHDSTPVTKRQKEPASSGGGLKGRWNNSRRPDRPSESIPERQSVAPARENSAARPAARVKIGRGSVEQPVVPDVEDELSEEELAQLSKSERRRYRKQQRKQHRRAA